MCINHVDRGNKSFPPTALPLHPSTTPASGYVLFGQYEIANDWDFFFFAYFLSLFPFRLFPINKLFCFSKHVNFPTYDLIIDKPRILSFLFLDASFLLTFRATKIVSDLTINTLPSNAKLFKIWFPAPSLASIFILEYLSRLFSVIIYFFWALETGINGTFFLSRFSHEAMWGEGGRGKHEIHLPLRNRDTGLVTS